MVGHIRLGARHGTRLACAAVVVLMLVACGKSAPQGSNLVGVWESEKAGSSGTMDFHADKTYVAKTSDGTLSGSWKIDNDRLIGLVAVSTIPQIPRGHAWSNQIDTLTDSRLVLRSRSGEAERYRRAR